LTKINFRCKGLCEHFQDTEKGHRNFAVEGKRWCSVCDYKQKLDKKRTCPCCGCRFRLRARTDKILQRKNQQELNSHFEIVSLYSKQT
jgi:uncharacterized paraquat-inducible protein A